MENIEIGGKVRVYDIIFKIQLIATFGSRHTAFINIFFPFY